MCYKNCKHYYCGFCTKYNESILISKHPLHRGILIHPLHFLTIYYDEKERDLSYLMEVVEKCCNDKVMKSILTQYKRNGFISHKQRKYLVYNILHCYEDKPKEDGCWTFVQVE